MEPVSTSTRTENVLHHLERFKVFGEMYGVREFQLVLRADVPDYIVESAMRDLNHIIKAEQMGRRLDYLLREPLIISEIRSPRTRLCEDVGSTGEWPINGSAL